MMEEFFSRPLQSLSNLAAATAAMVAFSLMVSPAAEARRHHSSAPSHRAPSSTHSSSHSSHGGSRHSGTGGRHHGSSTVV
ncbi:MAG TPA: hypothetical protein V6C72_16115, partial [Chroococcales cyanobacterium]